MSASLVCISMVFKPHCPQLINLSYKLDEIAEGSVIQKLASKPFSPQTAITNCPVPLQLDLSPLPFTQVLPCLTKPLECTLCNCER